MPTREAKDRACPAAERESPALQIKASSAATPSLDFTPKTRVGWDVLALVLARSQA
jgi:hypothetical protein